MPDARVVGFPRHRLDKRTKAHSVRPPDARAGWTTYAAFMCSRKDGRNLAVQLTPVPGSQLDDWRGVAMEVASADSSIGAVLDDHGHRQIGSGSLLTMMALAESFARAWQRSGQSVAACECEEIES